MSQYDCFNKYCNDNSKCMIENNLTMSCNHIDIVMEGNKTICNTCGEELDYITQTNEKEWCYYKNTDPKKTDPTRVHARKKDEKSINKDLINLPISDVIISSANVIYETVTNGKIYRGKSRKAIIFACVYHAYKMAGIPQAADSLLRIFDITKKNGLKGLKIVNINIPIDSEINKTSVSVVDIIKDILSQFIMDDKSKDEVVEIYWKIHNKSSKLNRARPQSVAASVVYYWIKKKDIKISIEDFANITNLSQMTITKNTKEVISILEN